MSPMLRYASECLAICLVSPCPRYLYHLLGLLPWHTFMNLTSYSFSHNVAMINHCCIVVQFKVTTWSSAKLVDKIQVLVPSGCQWVGVLTSLVKESWITNAVLELHHAVLQRTTFYVFAIVVCARVVCINTHTSITVIKLFVPFYSICHNIPKVN